jgi:plastocyanin
MQPRGPKCRIWYRVTLAACSLLAVTTTTYAAQHTITIEGVQYVPAEMTVRRGDTVVWVNKDPFPHTATADDKAFNSGSIDVNGSWKLVATKTGVHTYGCNFHPTMKGKLTVK